MPDEYQLVDVPVGDDPNEFEIGGPEAERLLKETFPNSSRIYLSSFYQCPSSRGRNNDCLSDSVLENNRGRTVKEGDLAEILPEVLINVNSLGKVPFYFEEGPPQCQRGEGYCTQDVFYFDIRERVIRGDVDRGFDNRGEAIKRVSPSEYLQEIVGGKYIVLELNPPEGKYTHTIFKDKE